MKKGKRSKRKKKMDMMKKKRRTGLNSNVKSNY
jgi:hypothetical protein